MLTKLAHEKSPALSTLDGDTATIDQTNTSPKRKRVNRPPHSLACASGLYCSCNFLSRVESVTRIGYSSDARNQGARAAS